MKYTVPQNLDVPEKVIGPLTFEQLIYIIGGGSFIVFIYFYTPIIVNHILALFVAISTLALAFYKPQQQHFVVFMRAAFFYFKNQKIFVWKKKSVLKQLERK